MRDLTVRGRCFLAAGAAAVVSGVLVGEGDFVRIGLLAAAVPLLAWLRLRIGSREVWARRTVGARQVEAGETAEVMLEVGPSGDRRTPALLLEEELPPALGDPQRFVLDPMRAQTHRSVRYRVRTSARGRFPIGPLQVRIADPTGMVDLHQEVSGTGSLLVTPRTEPLPRVALSGRRAGAGEERTRDLVGAGSPDVTIREYRLGDDLRRIHWPTTARTAELMVRREEQQWQTRCTLLLDNRWTSHRGHGTGSSIETAVSAAASITRALTGLDFEVRLVSATETAASTDWHRSQSGSGLAGQLERLALLQPTKQSHLSTAWFDESLQGGVVVAVLGRLAPHDLELLAGLAATGASTYAVVLDTATWEPGGSTEPPATARLRAQGWKAVTLGRGAPLAHAWQELAR